MPKDNIPEIRVAGFSEVQWSKKKCEDLLTERNVQHPQSEEYPLVSFTIEDGVTPKTERYERESLVAGDKNAKKYKETRLNDIVYNPANLKFGAIARNKYGNAVFSPIYVTFDVNRNFTVPEFMEMLVSKEDFIQDALQYQKGTVYERMSVCSTDFLNLDVKIPSIAEQQQIGFIFEKLDNLISQHYHKYEALVTVKKSMLEKMFPKDGETVPEVRFAGFTDPWEQRKLGEIFEEYSEKGHPELPALTIIQGGGTIRRDESDRSLQYDRASLSNYKMVNDGDFIVHLRSFEGGLEKATTLGIISPAYHTFHGEGTDSRFYYSYFRSPKFIDQDLKPHVYGIRDGRSIDIEGMKTIEIPWTSFDEQKAIGDYIDTLDNLITLHQRKCEVLKNLKSALLSKMFV